MSRRFYSWEPRPRQRVVTGRRPPPRKGKHDGVVYAVMGALVIGLPGMLSLIKGLEKRFMWRPAPAEIEEIRDGQIQYRYSARGKLFRHRQDYEPRTRRGGEALMPGDRVYVHVHTRNEALSILDPPIFQRIWKDFSGPDPYKGQLLPHQ